MLRCYGEMEQTEFSGVSLLGGSILDFQSPLPCCLLPPAVSRHEFPVLKSLCGVVKRPKPQHYISINISILIVILLLLLLLLPLPPLLHLLQLLLLPPLVKPLPLIIMKSNK